MMMRLGLIAGAVMMAGLVQAGEPLVTVDGKSPAEAGAKVTLCADGRVLVSATEPISTVRIEWTKRWADGTKYLNDAWERSRGDIRWQPVPEVKTEPWYAFWREDVKEGISPWYFLVTDGERTDGYGVKVQPNALCCWKVHTDGYALELDVTAGGRPVRLGGRTLEACTIVTREGRTGESAFAAGRAFCRMMCPTAKLAKAPVYGYNDWYCAYGKNTATNFLKDAAFVCSLAEGLKNRPYVVMDDGWQKNSPPVVNAYLDNGPGGSGYGPWNESSAQFGMGMSEFAAKVKALGAKPGLWYRPYRAWPGAPEGLKADNDTWCFDPTKPAVKRMIFEDVSRFRTWGFDLVKIDYLTKDLCGIYGLTMGDRVFHEDMNWADDTRTSAEVMLDLHRTMRAAAGDGMVIIGCNALNHLVAGLFELQRTGGDTSGWLWEQTRQNGVNTLAMRAVQDDIFFAVDADCAGLARDGAIPWRKNRQWIDLLGRSGTPVFISWKLELATPDVVTALKSAFRAASEPRSVAEPLDWRTSVFPSVWRFSDGLAVYDWD